MITLVSSDNETFEVEEAVAMVPQTIKHLIEDTCADKPIHLPHVTSNVLSKVIEFCRRHHDSGDTSDTDLKEFDAEFFKVDQNMLFDLILAANYLDIESLLVATCENVANMIKGKPIEEVRKLFHIKNDYTPEEEQEVRQENAWWLPEKEQEVRQENAWWLPEKEQEVRQENVWWLPAEKEQEVCQENAWWLPEKEQEVRQENALGLHKRAPFSLT